VADPFDNDLTAEDQTKQWILDSVIGSYGTVRAAYDNLQRMFWQNPTGLSAQQVCNIYGTRAGAFVTIIQGMTTYVNAVRAQLKTPGSALVSLKPSAATITVNADGSVTISGI
jgi:hypothetical protein